LNYGYHVPFSQRIQVLGRILDEFNLKGSEKRIKLKAWGQTWELLDCLMFRHGGDAHATFFPEVVFPQNSKNMHIARST
jgi:hypothetical protein